MQPKKQEFLQTYKWPVYTSFTSESDQTRRQSQSDVTHFECTQKSCPFNRSSFYKNKTQPDQLHKDLSV